MPGIWDNIGDNVRNHLARSRNIAALHTRCKIIVCSHVSEKDPIDISEDVVECSVTKTFDVGNFEFSLVPRKYYDRFIFPNDLVIIYLGSGLKEDPPYSGDGTSTTPGQLVKVMMGYVDRVSRSVQVDPDSGATSTRFRVFGTDLSKALSSTHVYFNPNIGREAGNDLNVFGSNLGNVQMFMSGVQLVGTPSTFARSVILAFLGYGGQFILPGSYPLRVKEGFNLETLLAEALRIEKGIGLLPTTFTVEEAQGNNSSQVNTIASRIARNKGKAPDRTLASLIDLFTYVEDFTVAGRSNFSAVDETNTTLLQLLHGYTNPDFNECFIDLRLSSHTEDEFRQTPSYMPALVMRECPFSYSNNLYETLEAKSAAGNSFRYLFGDVFFSGRKPEEMVSVISPEVMSLDGISTLMKRGIDSFVLPLSAILSEDTGYSDSDVFNFQFVLNEHWLAGGPVNQEALIQEIGLFPLTNTQSIQVDGLRVNQVHTQFANWGGELYGSNAQQTMGRYALLLDHWYQWNRFYRSGTFTTRLAPKIRIGYRMDLEGRDESYYVESVQHTWVYPGAGVTSISVTRGQPRSWRFKYYPPPRIKTWRRKIGNTFGLNNWELVKDASSLSVSRPAPIVIDTDDSVTQALIAQADVVEVVDDHLRGHLVIPPFQPWREDAKGTIAAPKATIRNADPRQHQNTIKTAVDTSFKKRIR